MSKYSVELYPGKGDRLPAWIVVRWDEVTEGKFGSKVFKCYDMARGEEVCTDYMNYLLDMEAGYLA